MPEAAPPRPRTHPDGPRRSARPRLRRPTAALDRRARLRLAWQARRLRTRATFTPRRLVALGIAGGLAMITVSMVERSQQVIEDLGRREPVVAATGPLPAGHRIDVGDVTVAHWPTGLAPSSAWTTAEQVIGRTTRQAVSAGEAITETDLGDGRLGLGRGEQAVTVVVPLAPPPAEVGDLVDLYAVGAEETPLGVEVTAELLGPGRLVATNEDGLTVAVDAALVPLILRAQAAGTVELALTP